MPIWTSDTELFALMRREMFTAVVGDVMDRIGLQTQFLPPHLTVLDRSMIIAGRAMTVLEADVFEEISETGANPLMAKPFGLMFEALDSLTQNDVYICTGSSPSYALWGGLMSTRALHLGAAGAVLEGYLRDTRTGPAGGLPGLLRPGSGPARQGAGLQRAPDHRPGADPAGRHHLRRSARYGAGAGDVLPAGRCH